MRRPTGLMRRPASRSFTATPSAPSPAGMKPPTKSGPNIVTTNPQCVVLAARLDCHAARGACDDELGSVTTSRPERRTSSVSGAACTRRSTVSSTRRSTRSLITVPRAGEQSQAQGGVVPVLVQGRIVVGPGAARPHDAQVLLVLVAQPVHDNLSVPSPAASSGPDFCPNRPFEGFPRQLPCWRGSSVLGDCSGRRPARQSHRLESALWASHSLMSAVVASHLAPEVSVATSALGVWA